MPRSTNKRNKKRGNQIVSANKDVLKQLINESHKLVNTELNSENTGSNGLEEPLRESYKKLISIDKNLALIKSELFCLNKALSNTKIESIKSKEQKTNIRFENIKALEDIISEKTSSSISKVNDVSKFALYKNNTLYNESPALSLLEFGSKTIKEKKELTNTVNDTNDTKQLIKSEFQKNEKLNELNDTNTINDTNVTKQLIKSESQKNENEKLNELNTTNEEILKTNSDIKEANNEQTKNSISEKISNSISKVKDVAKFTLYNEIPALSLLESAPKTIKEKKELITNKVNDTKQLIKSKFQTDENKKLNELNITNEEKKELITNKVNDTNNIKQLIKSESQKNENEKLNELNTTNEEILKTNSDIKEAINEQTKTLLEIDKEKALREEERLIDLNREKKSFIKSSGVIPDLKDNTKTTEEGSDTGASSLFDFFNRDKNNHETSRKTGKTGKFNKLGKLARVIGKSALANPLMILPGVGVVGKALSLATKVIGDGVSDGISGWNEASSIFGASEKDTTLGMKASSALGGALDGISSGLINKKETSKFVHNIGTKINKTIEDTVESVSETVSSTMSNIGGVLTGLTNDISTGISSTYDSVKSSISEFFGLSGSKDQEKESSVIDTIKSTVLTASPVGALVRSGKNLFSNFFSNDSSDSYNDISTGISSAYDSVKSSISGFFGLSDSKDQEKESNVNDSDINNPPIQRTASAHKKVGSNVVKSNTVPAGKLLETRSSETNNTRTQDNNYTEQKTQVIQPITNNYYYINNSTSGLENKGTLI